MKFSLIFLEFFTFSSALSLPQKPLKIAPYVSPVKNNNPAVDCDNRGECLTQSIFNFGQVQRYEPVCGSNQISYRNFCDLETEACKVENMKIPNMEIKFESNGLCDSLTDCRRDQFNAMKWSSQV